MRKRATGRVEIDYTEFERDLLAHPPNLWLNYLATDPSALNDYLHYLSQMIARVMARMATAGGEVDTAPKMFMAQGEIRALATIRKFVTSFLKEAENASGRVGSKDGDGSRESNARAGDAKNT